MEEEWNHPAHEEVVKLFAKHMSEKNMHDNVILNGINWWKFFCDRENPSIRNIAPYAAALDYFIQKEVLEVDNVTQAQIAEEYNTSPSTLSNTYQRLSNVLENKILK